jgi:hypothetical protein
VFAYLFLIAFSLITSALSVAVYAQTNRFSWFGIAAFLSVSLFIGASTCFRTRADPKAEPTPALVSSTKAVAGYFVAQTSDRIYLGEPAGSDTTESSEAITVANRMAIALCRQVPQPKKGITTQGVCPSVTGVAPSRLVGLDRSQVTVLSIGELTTLLASIADRVSISPNLTRPASPSSKALLS